MPFQRRPLFGEALDPFIKDFTGGKVLLLQWKIPNLPLRSPPTSLKVLISYHRKVVTTDATLRIVPIHNSPRNMATGGILSSPSTSRGTQSNPLDLAALDPLSEVTLSQGTDSVTIVAYIHNQRTQN